MFSSVDSFFSDRYDGLIDVFDLPGAHDNASEDRIYFVPYRWWKEARDSSSGNLNEATGVLYKELSVSSSDDDWNPEIVLNLRRAEDCKYDEHDEEAGSSREYALIPEAFFLPALKWHNESNVAVKDYRSTVADKIHGVFPLQIRLSILQEMNSLIVKICKKVSIIKKKDVPNAEAPTFWGLGMGIPGQPSPCFFARRLIRTPDLQDTMERLHHCARPALQKGDPSDSLALIRDNDQLVAYRSSKEGDTSTLVVFMHQRLEKYYHHEKSALDWKIYGIPLVAKMLGPVVGSNLRKEFLKLLEPFLMPNEDTLSDSDDAVNIKLNDADMDNSIPHVNIYNDESTAREVGDVQHSGNDFRFYLTVDRGSTKGPEIKMNEVSTTGYSWQLNVLVRWPDKMIDQYDTCLLSSLPEIFKPGLYVRRPQESVSLYGCLEAFLKEKPLGPEDMWYCPGCKKHRQAIKKLDFWRLPEILVVHLKRFSFSRFLKNKLETLIDFPIDNLDFSTYVTHKNDQFSGRYMLYAIINHYGSLGGGHYTAFVKHGRDQWYEFDDSSVHPVSEDDIKTSAAYVLFYKRIPDASYGILVYSI